MTQNGAAMNSRIKIPVEAENHALSFIDAFINKHKKDRLRNKWTRQKNRFISMDMLNHIDIGYFRNFTEINSIEDDIEKRISPYKHLKCYVFSPNEELDNTFHDIREAISLLESFPWAFIISVFPGKLAYYRDELSSSLPARYRFFQVQK